MIDLQFQCVLNTLKYLGCLVAKFHLNLAEGSKSFITRISVVLLKQMVT